MLRLLLQPPRSLCASTGHSPHLPSQEPVQPATARVLWSRDNFPGRTHGASGCCNVTPASAAAGLPLIPYPSLLPAWVSQSSLISCYFNPILSGRGTGDFRQTTCRGKAKSKLKPGAVRTKNRKGNLSMQPQEYSIKSPQSNWCMLNLCNTWIDNKSPQNWGGGCWGQL